MELLAEEDGWMVLSSLSQEDLDLVAPAVWDALAKVHALSLPGGGLPVLADCRPCNVMVRYVFWLLYSNTLVCSMLGLVCTCTHLIGVLHT